MAVVHLTEGAFDNAVAKGVTLVDFWAGWCGPCKMLAPVIESLAEQYDGKARICKVDIDAEMGLASRFGIMSIPTVLVFKDGELQQQTVGVQPEAVFKKMLDNALEA